MVVMVVRPAGLVVVHGWVAASKTFVQVLPLILFCSVRVARLVPVKVTVRVVDGVDESPEGVVVVTEGIGDSIPNRGSGESVSVVVVPSGIVVVDTPLAPNWNAACVPSGSVLSRLNVPVVETDVWNVVCRPSAIVEVTVNALEPYGPASSTRPPCAARTSSSSSSTASRCSESS